MDKPSYVYILANRPYGTLYIGVTSDLIKRIWQHREAAVASFTKTYGIKTLVWYEIHTDIRAAITREKQLKTWHRNWKINLIQSANPRWHDLFPALCT
ncbi:GIY-YIG nuclease family protein [Massilia aurea]|uniref:GIY-YIG nuclease family protein n=1 Tax=Massilia aurea TaxID=373040 RepID=UPI0034623EA4